MTVPENKPKLKGRWFQYSLSSLAVFVTLLCVSLAWLAYERNLVRERVAAIEAIEKLGGNVGFDSKKPFRPTWLRSLVGDNTPGEVIEVAIHNPQFSDADLIHLTGLPELNYLYLNKTHVTDAGLARLVKLKKLKVLSLWRSKEVTDAGLTDLKTALPNIQIDQ
jgi:hypothetical protein